MANGEGTCRPFSIVISGLYRTDVADLHKSLNGQHQTGSDGVALFDG